MLGHRCCWCSRRRGGSLNTNAAGGCCWLDWWKAGYNTPIRTVLFRYSSAAAGTSVWVPQPNSQPTESPEWVGVLHNHSSTINSFSRPQAVVVVARFFCVLLRCRVRRDRDTWCRCGGFSIPDPVVVVVVVRLSGCFVPWCPKRSSCRARCVVLCLCVIRFRFESSFDGVSCSGVSA